MAIIYTYPQTSNFKSDDCFIISDGSDNKTKKLSASGLLSWIDNNLEYDLQQVLNAGSKADATTGTWTTVDIWKNEAATEPFIKIEPGNEHLYVYGEIFMRTGATKPANIKTDNHQPLSITSDDALTETAKVFQGVWLLGFEESLTSGNYSTQVQEGEYKVTTNANKQVYMSAGEPDGFEFLAVPGTVHKPNLHLRDSINLYIESTVTDSLGAIGTADKVLKSNAQGYVEWADYAAPAAASPTKSIQFNKGNNEFGGEEAFKYDSASNTMEVGIPVSEFGRVRIHSEEAPSSNVGQLALHDGTGQALVIQPPITANTDYVLTLPEDAPGNAVSYLVSNTSGELSWTAASGGGSASGGLGSIQLSDGNGNFTSSDFKYLSSTSTLNVGIGNNTNTTAQGVIIGASAAKSGTLSILGPQLGKVQFQAASTGNASVALTFPDTTPQANQILQSDASGQLSWINTPSGSGGSPAGSQYEIQYNDGSNQFGADTSFTRDANGTISISTQTGQWSALSASANNNLTTQGFQDILGVANFDNADTSGGFSTVVAIRSANTTQANTELITFYTPSATTPSGSIVYDTNTSQLLIPTTSDERLKENKSDYDKLDAKNKIKALNVKKYNFKDDETNKEIKGFFAQQVKSVIPEAVIGEETDTWGDGTIKPMSINMHVLIPYLTAALQEAQETIETLQASIATLQGDVGDLDNDYKELKEKQEKIQEDVSDIQGDVSDIEQDITTVKTNVETNTTEIVSVKTTAETAKTTAEIAKTTADTAKTTADTAKTTADTAKTTADTAKTTADTANQKANDNEIEIAKKADKEEGEGEGY
mgnify:CR=1 FL=1